MSDYKLKMLLDSVDLKYVKLINIFALDKDYSFSGGKFYFSSTFYLQHCEVIDSFLDNYVNFNNRGEFIYVSDSISEDILSVIYHRVKHCQTNINIIFDNILDGRKIKQIIDVMESDIKKDKFNINFYINIYDRRNFLYEAFDDYEQNCRIIVYNQTDIDAPSNMNEYIAEEKKIYEMMEFFYSQEEKLSPFEKLLWLYHDVCSFRTYQMEEEWEDADISRTLHKILFNDKITCVGFCRLLIDMARRVGLEIWEVLSMDEDFYDHMCSLVSLQDDKYDIHGVYLLDPTNDNETDKSFYLLSRFMLTPEQCLTNTMTSLYIAGYSLFSDYSYGEFQQLLKNGDEELVSLIAILKRYYPDNEILQTNVVNYSSFYYEHSQELYDMVQNVSIEEISEDKIRGALSYTLSLKNPDHSMDEVEEYVDIIMDIYRDIYNICYPAKAKEKTLSDS